MGSAADGTPPVQVGRQELADLLATLCPLEGIDLAGAVSLPCPLPHAEHWQAYLESGRHAGLEYLSRDPAGRIDPTRGQPWARALLIFAQRYSDGWDPADPGAREGCRPDAPWTDGVARYARGLDYHDVLLRAIKRVTAGLREALPGLRSHAATDTGPYLEREYAWLAGLGFLGKNSCLIHEELGSALLLGVALTNLNVAGLPPGGEPVGEALYSLASGRVRPQTFGPATAADTTRCGRCTACLEACPTGALIAPFTLDANRCISTWTIEWRGQAPAADSHLRGGLFFGCDICQAVCPWNGRAFKRAQVVGRELPSPPVEYRTLVNHQEIDLTGLATMDDEEFRRRFRRTPLWRCHPEGLRRNAAAVAANIAANAAAPTEGKQAETAGEGEP